MSDRNNNEQEAIELVTAPDVKLPKEWQDYSLVILQESLKSEIKKRDENLNGISLVAPEELLANGIANWLLLTDIFSMQSEIMSNALEEESEIVSDLVLAASVIAKVHNSISEQMSRLFAYMIAFKVKIESNEETADLIKAQSYKYYEELLEQHQIKSQDCSGEQ